MAKNNIFFLNSFKKNIPGLILTSLVAYISVIISHLFLIGSVAIAIIIGIIINNFPLFKLKIFKDGITFAEKNILSLSIVLMGASLDLNRLSFISIFDISFIVVLIFISIVLCFLIGKIFDISTDMSLMLGIGNGICGSSAIAGVSKITGFKRDEVGISIAIINIVGALSIFVLPYILINLFSDFNSEQNGFVIGSTIQAVGQVTAAGYILEDIVGEHATLIKMIRILMLAPFLFLLSLALARKNKTNLKIKSIFYVPNFIVGFIALSILVTMGVLPDYIIEIFKYFSKIFLIIAMAGIGLSISFQSIKSFGLKPLFVCLISFSIQVMISILITNYNF